MLNRKNRDNKSYPQLNTFVDGKDPMWFKFHDFFKAIEVSWYWQLFIRDLYGRVDMVFGLYFRRYEFDFPLIILSLLIIFEIIE